MGHLSRAIHLRRAKGQNLNVIRRHVPSTDGEDKNKAKIKKKEDIFFLRPNTDSAMQPVRQDDSQTVFASWL